MTQRVSWSKMMGQDCHIESWRSRIRLAVLTVIG
uniref:Uncharacterized protein n=1 Tax=Rhizophora mucronata TaxID=61149 RepID=A0A2P2J2H4_RHIMU